MKTVNKIRWFHTTGIVGRKTTSNDKQKEIKRDQSDNIFIEHDITEKEREVQRTITDTELKLNFRDCL